MKTTRWAALVLCGLLTEGAGQRVSAEGQHACGTTSCCGNMVVRHGQGGHAPTAARSARGRGVVAHFPSDGTPLLLPHWTGAHGTHYGRPYNYRNLLDYPWHAPLRGVNAATFQPAPVPAVAPQPRADDGQFDSLPPVPDVETIDSA